MKWRKAAVYDVLHKTTVTFVMAFSAVLTGYIGYSTLHWFRGIYCAKLHNMSLIVQCA